MLAKKSWRNAKSDANLQMHGFYAKPKRARIERGE